MHHYSNHAPSPQGRLALVPAGAGCPSQPGRPRWGYAEQAVCATSGKWGSGDLPTDQNRCRATLHYTQGGPNFCQLTIPPATRAALGNELPKRIFQAQRSPTLRIRPSSTIRSLNQRPGPTLHPKCSLSLGLPVLLHSLHTPPLGPSTLHTTPSRQSLHSLQAEPPPPEGCLQALSMPLPRQEAPRRGQPQGGERTASLPPCTPSTPVTMQGNIGQASP